MRSTFIAAAAVAIALGSAAPAAPVLAPPPQLGADVLP
jgi:hypothetical protein